MILTQIELDQIMQEVSYIPETGEFVYNQDLLLSRRYKKPMAVEKPPKISHKAGDRADKIYANKYVGVYVLKRVVNAAHLALYFMEGHWPEAVKFRNGDWGDITAPNLESRTRSQQTTEAAMARYDGFERTLPPNVYGTSSGKFIGRRGRRRTREYESAREVVQAIGQDKWLV